MFCRVVIVILVLLHIWSSDLDTIRYAIQIIMLRITIMN